MKNIIAAVLYIVVFTLSIWAYGWVMQASCFVGEKIDFLAQPPICEVSNESQ